MSEKTAAQILRVMKTMDTLEALPRSGYLLRGIRNPESVAAHSFGTALLAMLLADAEENIDAAKTLRMAVLHETGEARMTDIPLVAKRLFPEGALHQAESKAEAEILGELDDGNDYLALLDEFREQKTREARLVKAADKLQMLIKVRLYEQAGAGGLEEFFQLDQGMKLDGFPVAQALFSLLKQQGERP